MEISKLKSSVLVRWAKHTTDLRYSCCYSSYRDNWIWFKTRCNSLKFKSLCSNWGFYNCNAFFYSFSQIYRTLGKNL